MLKFCLVFTHHSWLLGIIRPHHTHAVHKKHPIAKLSYVTWFVSKLLLVTLM